MVKKSEDDGRGRPALYEGGAMPPPGLRIRFPQHILDWLDRESEARGESRASIVRDLVERARHKSKR